MKRALVVVASTTVGIVGLLSFKTSPVKVVIAVPSTTPTSTTVPSTGPTLPTTTPQGIRSATGPVLNFYYGTMAVKVTMNGTTITGTEVVNLNDGGSQQSQSIDQYAIPILQQEVLSAQSGAIQSVSGASYTSAGFTQSLQAALTALRTGG